jgi:2-polyprenyl-3-methyl-5-hydroxy-6-metoxy-1,4-benzoquinol methylase
MTGSGETALVWDRSTLPDFYRDHRRTTEDVYPSEWLFLKELLHEGVSILDVGCALGGFASIVSEHVERFRYTGADVSEAMLSRAAALHPRHRFVRVADEDLAALGDERFDLVLCLGVLHMTRRWRPLLQAAWARASHWFLFDLRQTPGSTLEDVATSYFVVADVDGTAHLRLPYNVINATEALQAVLAGCPGHASLRQFASLASPSPAAITPARDVFMTTYCLQRTS